MASDLVPTGLPGRIAGKKVVESATEPQEPVQPPPDPNAPLIVQNVTTVAWQQMEQGFMHLPQAVHQQLVRATNEWAEQNGRDLSNVQIVWECRLTALGTKKEPQ